MLKRCFYFNRGEKKTIQQTSHLYVEATPPKKKLTQRTDQWFARGGE